MDNYIVDREYLNLIASDGLALGKIVINSTLDVNSLTLKHIFGNKIVVCITKNDCTNVNLNAVDKTGDGYSALGIALFGGVGFLP